MQSDKLKRTEKRIKFWGRIEIGACFKIWNTNEKELTLKIETGASIT